MKIILCIFLLNITAVSVFGKPQELHGIVGESVKFPAAVKEGGSLIHSGVTLGEVASGKFTVTRDEKYRDRLDWDSSTGFFSLSVLKMEDIGEYKVHNTDQNIITVFQLKMHVPVSKPNVSITHNEYSCTIECTAESGTGVTLSWYREGEKKSLVSSRVASAPGLHLPETVESGTYTCEAKNSVSRETSDPLTTGAHCTAPAAPAGSSTMAIVTSVSIAVVVIAVVLVAKHHRFIRRRLGFIIGCLESLGLSERKHERRIEERDPTPLRDDLS